MLQKNQQLFSKNCSEDSFDGLSKTATSSGNNGGNEGSSNSGDDDDDDRQMRRLCGLVGTAVANGGSSQQSLQSAPARLRLASYADSDESDGDFSHHLIKTKITNTLDKPYFYYRFQQSAEHHCPKGRCRFVRINVSGLLFEICSSYLDRHPLTLMGDKAQMEHYWQPHEKEYFFDRHRPSFEGIFAYFKYGDLPRKPDGVPDDVFLDELCFFRIEDEIVDQWKESRGMPIFHPQKYILKNTDGVFRQLWYMFEFPAHSRWSYALNIISVIAAIVAVMCLIIESMPSVATSHCLEDFKPNFQDKFFIIESICTAWFTLELLVRTIGAPTWRDLCNYQTAIDIAANTPYFVILISVLISMDCRGAKASASTGFLRIFRLFSVFKLSDRSGAFALIANTFKASTRVLTLFFLALAVCVVLFGSFIYIIEAEADSPQTEFQSIADGFWWATITMTTVSSILVPILPPFDVLI